MKVLETKKKDVDFKDFIKRSAKEEDYDTLITEPTIITENGEVKIIYDVLDFDTAEVVKTLQRVKYQQGKRSRGLVSTSRIFGYRPRNEMRQDFCSSTSLATEQPKEHEIICSLASKLEGYYEKYNQPGYEKHKELSAEKVKNEWRINGSSCFTSGIINKNNPLKYHHDTGNFNDVFSLMIVFKGGVEGGYLACPEYGLGFALPNNSILLFDGQSILHGVTPIKYTSPVGYRYSVVYYTLKRMWQCLTINEEIARIRQAKTVRERVRMNVPLTEEERRMKVERAEGISERKVGWDKENANK